MFHGGNHQKTSKFPWTQKMLPSGKHTKSYRKSPFFMGKSTISMAIFNSFLYVYQFLTIVPWMAILESSMAIRQTPKCCRSCVKRTAPTRRNTLMARRMRITRMISWENMGKTWVIYIYIYIIDLGIPYIIIKTLNTMISIIS